MAGNQTLSHFSLLFRLLFRSFRNIGVYIVLRHIASGFTLLRIAVQRGDMEATARVGRDR